MKGVSYLEVHPECVSTPSLCPSDWSLPLDLWLSTSPGQLQERAVFGLVDQESNAGHGVDWLLDRRSVGPNRGPATGCHDVVDLGCCDFHQSALTEGSKLGEEEIECLFFGVLLT